MAITAQLCRVSAEECRRRAVLSVDPNASAAYHQLVCAWLVLADTVEELTKLRRAERETTTAKAA